MEEEGLKIVVGKGNGGYDRLTKNWSNIGPGMWRTESGKVFVEERSKVGGAVKLQQVNEDNGEKF